MQLRSAALLMLALSACGATGTKTLELTLTMPDGKKTTHNLGGDTGFLFESGGGATASWPDIGTWNTKVPVGLSMRFAPLQAGRFNSSGNLHLGSGTVADAKSLTLAITAEHVRWQNSGAFPFRMEGTFEGTSPEGHKVAGKYSTTTDDCSDKVKANGNSWLCGLPFPSKDYAEQVWTVGRWDVTGTCPADLVKRYTSGSQLTISGSAAKSSGETSLQCVVSYPNAYRVICGASEEGLTFDGCTWAVTAYALPGAVPYETGHMGLVAGTTDKTCEPKFCEITAMDVVHVSGARP